MNKKISAVSLFILLALMPVISHAAQQESFASPEQAGSALVDANRNGKEDDLLKILGPEAADLIRATTIFTALSIVDALCRFVLPRHEIHQLVVSGGGARNPLILAQLSAALPEIDILPSARLGVPEDAKEAFAFALMAYETFHRRPANLPSATGARGAAILGKISYAPPR